MAHTMKDERDHHQNLMNLAYARWNDPKDLKDKSYEAFLQALDPVQAYAVALGKLNQQVTCNGYGGWHFNGYPEDAGLTKLALINMESQGFRLAHSVLGLTEAALTLHAEFEAYYSECQDTPEQDPDCDEQDGEFYKLNEDFLIQCEVYLRQLSGETVPQDLLDHHAEALARAI